MPLDLSVRWVKIASKIERREQGPQARASEIKVTLKAALIDFDLCN